MSLAALGLSVTLAGISYAGSFSSDFSSMPGGAAVYGTAVSDGAALVLTPAAASQQGSFVIDDLDPGSRISSFVATFNLHMGNGSANPGDGACFVFGTDIPNADFNEEGVPNSGPAISGLVITFDAYDNSLGDNTEGPEFRIKYNSTLIARRKLSNQFRTGAGYVPVEVRYTSAGTLTLVYNNIVMYTNLFAFSPMVTGARFGFGARCGGGAYQEQSIDDLSITTTPVSRFYVKGSVTPSPAVDASANTTFQLQLQDGSAAVAPATVSMSFNGISVTPVVDKPGAVTTISYDPPGSLLPGSLNRMHVSFSYLADATVEALDYEFTVAPAPLWSLAPLSRPYLPLDTDVAGGTTPLYRTLALNPALNHLYIVSRALVNTGLSISVLDAKTGADLYQLNTNGIGIPPTGFILMNIAVADDGALYAASISATASSPKLNVYRWADDSSATVPTVVFSGDPGASVLANKRWGDTLTARGSGLNTQLLLDCNANPMSALLTPTDTSWVSNFTAACYSDTYVTAATAIGRSIQFGPTNTFWLKKRSSLNSGGVPVMPLALIQNNSAPTTTPLLSISAFYGQVGQLTVDLARNLAAGIMYVTNTAAADHLVVYDISNLASPLQLAQYNFPVTHQKNNNMLGEVVIGTDQIYALDCNNGIIAAPIVAPTTPALHIAAAGASAVLSWSNTVPGFVLQSASDLAAPVWSPVAQPVIESGPLNFVTNTPTSPAFYRLLK